MRIRNDLIPGLPAYEADNDGSDAPWVWYGQSANRAFSASAEPWNSAPLMSQWFDRTTDQVYRKVVAGAAGAWELVGRLSGRTVTVGALGQYTTLSAALAAITDASDSNEYLIVVSGEIAETAAIAAKSHVNVFFLPGACVTVTSTSTLNAVNFSAVTNVLWAAANNQKPNIVRSGALGATASHGILLSNCGNTVRLYNLNVMNQTTGYDNCYGIYLQVSNPLMVNCAGYGGSGGTNCYGIYNYNNSSPFMVNCAGYGGSGGTGGHGIYNASGCNPLMQNCTGYGGSSNASCSGIYNYTGNPTMQNCAGYGGSGGATCYGIINNRHSNPLMVNCAGYGGSGGTGGHGIYNVYTSAPHMVNCLGCGGGAAPANGTTAVVASTRSDDSYLPVASQPYRVIAAALTITAAADSGVTLTLRDAAAGGGNALSAAVAVDSTGDKFIPITGFWALAAGSPVYGNLSTSDSTLAYTIRYTYTIEYDTCYGLYEDSNARHDVISGVFLGNGTSPAVYVTNNGDDASLFLGGVARSGMNSGTRPKAFVCQSAWNPASVYNMMLDGGSTNLTAAAGTANGTCVEV